MFGRKKAESKSNKTSEEWKVCHFQVRKQKKSLSRPFECALTAYAAYKSSGVTRIECNPDLCPIYQTWKLLQETQ